MDNFRRIATVSIKVKFDLVGRIIGQGGWRITKILENTDVSVKFLTGLDENGNIECVITGKNLPSVEMVRSRIQVMVDDNRKGFFGRSQARAQNTKNEDKEVGKQRAETDDKNFSKDPDLSFKIKKVYVPRVIGRGGKRILKIQAQTNTKIGFEQGVDKNGYVDGWIRGNQKASREKAIKLIHEILKRIGPSIQQPQDLHFTEVEDSTERQELKRQTNRSCWRCDKKFGQYTTRDRLKSHAKTCNIPGYPKASFRKVVNWHPRRRDWERGCENHSPWKRFIGDLIHRSIDRSSDGTKLVSDCEMQLSSKKLPTKPKSVDYFRIFNNGSNNSKVCFEVKLL